MSLLDFLKNKEKAGKAKEKNSEKEERQVPEEGKHKAKKIKTKNAVSLKSSKSAFKVLKEPHITEKSTDLAKLNQYVFRVFGDASKPAIKKAVEDVYEVHVERVSKIQIPRKQRRRGRQKGWRPGYTKAIVKLRQGESIEVLPH